MMSSEVSDSANWVLPLPSLVGVAAGLTGQTLVLPPETMVHLIEATQLPIWLQEQRQAALLELRAELAEKAESCASALQQDLAKQSQVLLSQWRAQLTHWASAVQAAQTNLEVSLRPALLSTLEGILPSLPQFEERLVAAVVGSCRKQIEAASGLEVFAHPEAMGAIQRAMASEDLSALIVFTPQEKMEVGQWRIHLGSEMLLIDTELAMQGATEAILKQVVLMHARALSEEDQNMAIAKDSAQGPSVASEFVAGFPADESSDVGLMAVESAIRDAGDGTM